MPTRRAPAGPRPSRSRRPRARARSPRPPVEGDDRGPAHERARRQRAREPRGAAGRQHVVRPGGVVAERRGAAGARRTRSPRPASARCPRRRLRSAARGARARARRRARARPRARERPTSASGASATLGRSGAASRTRSATASSASGIRRDRRRAGCRTPCSAWARRLSVSRHGVGRVVQDRPRARSVPRGRRCQLSPKSWRLASVTQALPGPATTSTGSIVSVPSASAATAVRAAQRVDLVRARDRSGGEGHRADAAVGLRRRRERERARLRRPAPARSPSGPRTGRPPVHPARRRRPPRPAARRSRPAGPAAARRRPRLASSSASATARMLPPRAPAPRPAPGGRGRGPRRARSRRIRCDSGRSTTPSRWTVSSISAASPASRTASMISPTRFTSPGGGGAAARTPSTISAGSRPSQSTRATLMEICLPGHARLDAELVDLGGPQLVRHPVRDQARGRGRDLLADLEPVLAQRPAGVDQVHDRVGQPGDRRQLDGALDLDHLRAPTGVLEETLSDARVLGGDPQRRRAGARARHRARRPPGAARTIRQPP